MAIGIFKSLIFGDVNSADYGIYITGEAVYNAPERAVEMVTVPGRNGAIALDQGRWENIEVSYPAGCFGGDQSDFASKISEFRNAIVSQIGYQRLTDEYNPNEYRMAVYAEGLDVKPKSKGRAGEFTITFDCKPQRYLTSGETEITVESGDVLTNPTQYESSPLLAVKGYGTIGFNGYEVELENAIMGDVELFGSGTKQGVISPSSSIIYETTYNTELLNASDTEIWSGITLTIKLDAGAGWTFTAASLTSPQSGTFKFNMTYTGIGTRYLTATLRADASISMSAGTAVAEDTSTFKIDTSVQTSGGSSGSGFRVFGFKYKKTVNGSNESVTLTLNYAENFPESFEASVNRGTLTGHSTISLLGDPTYIDCDLGECYRIDNEEYASLNGKIALGSDLPTLAPGENEITFDNTVADLVVTPRWWRL